MLLIQRVPLAVFIIGEFYHTRGASPELTPSTLGPAPVILSSGRLFPISYQCLVSLGPRLIFLPLKLQGRYRKLVREHHSLLYHKES